MVGGVFLASGAVLALVATTAIAGSSRPPVQERTIEGTETADGARPGDIAIDFRGGDAGLAMADILARLLDAGLLPTRTIEVKGGDTICGLMVAQGFPPACRALTKTISRLNADRKANLGTLAIGDVIVFPDVRIEPGKAARKAETSELSAILKGTAFRWPGLQLRRLDSRDEIIFTSYRMYVPTVSDEEAKAAYRLVPASENVVPSRIPRGSISAALHSLADLRTGDPCDAQPFAYRELLAGDTELDDLATADEVISPLVMLVDVKLRPTPDVPWPKPPAPTPAACKVVDFDWGVHHATLLAGIIAGNGVRFRGLTKRSRFENPDWGISDPANPRIVNILPDAKDKLGRRLDSLSVGTSGLLIMLAATNFPPEDDQAARIDEDEANRAKLPLNASIWNKRILLVASVGQREPGGSEPLDWISPAAVQSPQNLGDWENVILVTACDACGPGRITLLPEAYRPVKKTLSTITLAAPGGRAIAGSVSDHEVAAAAGTSQAAAYVAGVAAAMYARYPGIYVEPGRIKYWLSATAWPVLDGMGDDLVARVLQFGVVDPARALLSPASSYLLPVGGHWRMAKLRRWTQGAVKVRLSSGLEQRIETADIARIVDVSPQPDAGTGPRPSPRYAILVRSNKSGKMLELSRIGPVTGFPEGAPQLETCTGTETLNVASLSDIILPMGPLAEGAGCDQP